MKIAILDDYQRVALQLADWSSLPAGTEVEVFGEPALDEDALVARLAPFDVVVAMRERTAFPASVIERLPRLRLIASTGLRNAAIDLDACARRGVATCGSRGAPTGLAATAEVAWALVLALAKRVVVSDAATRRGVWQPVLADPLAGRVLGLVGLGNLGQRMARIAGAFDMDVVAWSPHLTPERAAAAGARFVAAKREVFACADVVSLHLVLAASTAGIVGPGELAAMKPTASLVNTARAGLVDEQALLGALRERRIAGAGLDVHWREPLAAGDAWLALDNVVLSPHLGYATRDNLAAFYGGVVDNLRAWLAGATPRPLSA